MRYAKLAFVFLGLAAILVAAEPFAGTWKLNSAKTKYKTGTAPKEQTLTITEAGTDLDVTISGTAADGSAIMSHYTVPAQGGDGKIIQSTYEAVSGKRIGLNEREITYSKGGKAMLTAHSRVSADGKTLTVNVKGTDAQGKPVAGVAVYDKVLVAASMTVAAAPSDTPDSVDLAYQQSFDKWKADLVDDLKQNWLPLAGLFWLKPGENPFGRDAGNTIVFPGGPARAGVFVLQGEEVTMKLTPDNHFTIDGKPVTTATLQPDTSGKPTVVELGSLRFHVIKRGQRVGIRLKDLDSKAVKDYRGPVFFPLNLNYRITAAWVPSEGKKTVDVPNVLGDVTPMAAAGTAVFKINGQELRLTDLGGDPSEGLFFVFNDLTIKTDTYPGGRFLQTDPVVNGAVVLDFNRAFNPPCAVTPYATCPLAPKENRLAVAIPAGEKYDRTHGHQ